MGMKGGDRKRREERKGRREGMNEGSRERKGDGGMG